MGPNVSNNTIDGFLQKNDTLGALRFIVDRVWGLESNTRYDASRVVTVTDESGTLKLHFQIVEESNSRTGDIFLTLLDTTPLSDEFSQSVANMKRGEIFSKSFNIKLTDDPRSRAFFNCLCLLADTLQRDTDTSKIKNLDGAVVKSALSKILNNRIDFPSGLCNRALRLYCDDYENLGDGKKAAWIEFKLSADQTELTLTFSQTCGSPDFRPEIPGLCIREPFCGGSMYRTGRVHSALKILFAADALFPEDPQLIMPSVS